jgi:hypothetical protein
VGDKDHTDSEELISKNDDVLAVDEAVSSVESDSGDSLYIEEESPEITYDTGSGNDSAGNL